MFITDHPSPSLHPGATPVGVEAVQVEGDVPVGAATSSAVPTGATIYPSRSYLSVHLSPSPTDTTVHLHEPDISAVNGRIRRIVAIRVCDDATIQFNTPREAEAWLDHCMSLIVKAEAL